MSDIIAVVDAWEADLRATGVEYQIEKERIGDTYLVRKLTRYAEPETVFGLASEDAAQDLVEADKSSRRASRRRSTEKKEAAN